MLPNFIVIGAAKSGTTSLYYYLKQHPEIFMSPIKEPKFFWLENREANLNDERTEVLLGDYTDNVEDYKELFKEVKDEKAIGEASTVYIGVPEIPKRIKYYIYDAKLIAVLRNPVDRARSAHSWNVQIGIEPIYDFKAAINEELRNKHWRNYLELGFYHNQLRHYFNTFEKDQMKIYLYEDLINNPNDMLKDIFKFLGVDPSFAPNMTQKFNVSAVPRYRLLNSILGGASKVLPKDMYNKLNNSIKEWNSTKPNPVSPELRSELSQYFKDDILKLQSLINKDLSHWIE